MWATLEAVGLDGSTDGDGLAPAGPLRSVAVGAGTLLATVGTNVLVWWPTLGVGFLGDDLEGIARAGVASPAGPVDTSGPPLYRPLALASLRADHARAGLDPSAYHLTNVVLAGVAAWLVGWVVFGLWRRSAPGGRPGRDAAVPFGDTRVDPVPGGPVAAVVAAGLFSIWPSHGEVVAWVGGRGDVLCAVGCLAALAVWLRAEWTASARDRWVGVSVSVVLLVAALASKESALVWPAVTAVLVVGARWSSGVTGRPLRDAALRTWPLWAAAGGWVLWRSVRLGDVVGGYGGGSFAGGAPVGPLRRFGSVLARSALPALPPAGWWVAGAVVVAAVLGLVLAVRRDRRRLVWPWSALAACWLLTALPGAGLGVSATGSIGERLGFLASVFVVTAVGWAVALLWSTRRTVAVVTAVSVAAVAVVVLVPAQQRWLDAGGSGRELTRALGTLQVDRPTVLLTLPDEQGGAYVGRNAVPSTLALLHGWRDPSAVWGATTFRSDGPALTTVTPIPAPDAPAGSRRWRVSVDGPGARFGELFPRPGSDGRAEVRVVRVDDRTVEVTVGPPVDGEQVAVLEGDRARVLPDPGG